MQHVVYAYLYPDFRVQCCMHRCETKVRHILRQWSVPERRRRPATRQARGYLRKDAGSNRENVPCRPTGTSPTTSRGVRRRGSRLFSAGQKMVRGNVGLATSIKSRYVYTFAPQSVFRLPTPLPPMVYRDTTLVVQTRPFTSPTACRCVHTLHFGHARGPAARSPANTAPIRSSTVLTAPFVGSTGWVKQPFPRRLAARRSLARLAEGHTSGFSPLRRAASCCGRPGRLDPDLGKKSRGLHAVLGD